MRLEMKGISKVFTDVSVLVGNTCATINQKQQKNGHVVS